MKEFVLSLNKKTHNNIGFLTFKLSPSARNIFWLTR